MTPPGSCAVQAMRSEQGRERSPVWDDQRTYSRPWRSLLRAPLSSAHSGRPNRRSVRWSGPGRTGARRESAQDLAREAAYPQRVRVRPRIRPDGTGRSPDGHRVTNARKRITDPEVRERRRSITYARTAGLSMCASRRRTSPSSTALFHGRSSPGLPSCADTRVMLEYLQRGPKRLGGHANTRLHALTCMSVSPRCASLPIAVSPPGSHRGTRARPQRSTVPR
jgi:hypothetical protein